MFTECDECYSSSSFFFLKKNLHFFRWMQEHFFFSCIFFQFRRFVLLLCFLWKLEREKKNSTQLRIFLLSEKIRRKKNCFFQFLKLNFFSGRILYFLQAFDKKSFFPSDCENCFEKNIFFPSDCEFFFGKNNFFSLFENVFSKNFSLISADFRKTKLHFSN